MSSAGSDVVEIPLALGNYPITIIAPHDLEAEIRSTFDGFLRTGGSKRGAEIRIVGYESGGRISVDGREWEPGQDQSVIDQLMYVIMRSALDRSPELLHLHAAYVAAGGGGVIIAGFTGSGKSTLVTQLVMAGFNYLTDERIGVSRAGQINPLRKPISVVAGSFDVLRHLDPALTGHGSATWRLWHIPPSAIRPGAIASGAEPRLIVFSEYHKNAPLDVEGVHPAEAVRLLLSDSPDAQRFGSDALLVTARLCASTRCVRIRYGHGDQAIAAITRQLQFPAPSIGVELIRFPADVPHGRKNGVERIVGPAPGLSGVVIGSRCVLVDRAMALVELDESATAWLRLLDGVTPLSAIVREVAEGNEMEVATVAAVADSVVDRLAAIGVVR